MVSGSTQGSNSHGQLGQGNDTEQLLIPTQFEINVEPKYITGGGKHTLILSTQDQLLSCGDNDKETLDVLGWGSNSFGQLGMPVDKVKCLNSPTNVFNSKAIQIGAGLRHSVIITLKGSVFTSGYGRKGQLGFNINGVTPQKTDAFTEVEDVSDCVDVSCGEWHCIVRTSKGEFYSWGNNHFGQLGLDPEIIKFSKKPVKINLSLPNREGSQLVSEVGQLITWGRNDFGQLGEYREHTWKPEILKVVNEKITKICLGSHHCVALTHSGSVLTWGWNEHGNCGNNSCENIMTPQRITGTEQVKLIGCGAAHSFYYLIKFPMLEICDFTQVPSFNTSNLKEIPVINDETDYSEFFYTYLIPNKPCVINGITHDWPCTQKWIKNEKINLDYFSECLENVDVPVSNCGAREYNVQKKCTMKLFDYLDYLKSCRISFKNLDCFYLKDWHYIRDFPNENTYRVPAYFASDWLNEYYDGNPDLNDDYKFVYIGPKHSWTPFHADVFTSYSWSVNVFGRKKWILIPPGNEKYLTDSLGNLKYDITPKDLNDPRIQVFEVIQEQGQAIFVPSGWHHQVWNLEETISINHNWINGCNIHQIWNSLKKTLSHVKAEISDCNDMEDWPHQCQIILSSIFGFNFRSFGAFLSNIAKARIKALRGSKNLTVFGGWKMGENHLKYDLIRVLTVLNLLKKDDDFVCEYLNDSEDDDLNHSFEFLDCLNNCSQGSLK
ncbi:hypothetical protein RUM44_007437 [Polyplax serrata]|uniref:Jumonji domain-containing protein 4 n=1 Tax=Polyplax serrata TaxID=468196 RepID=A0ABR1B0N2_POLSC